MILNAIYAKLNESQIKLVGQEVHSYLLHILKSTNTTCRCQLQFTDNNYQYQSYSCTN